MSQPTLASFPILLIHLNFFRSFHKLSISDFAIPFPILRLHQLINCISSWVILINHLIVHALWYWLSHLSSVFSHVLPTVSDTGVPPCHDAKLSSIISLCLSLPLFPLSFTIVIFSIVLPLLMMSTENVNCFSDVNNWLFYELASFKKSYSTFDVWYSHHCSIKSNFFLLFCRLSMTLHCTTGLTQYKS